MIFTQAHIFVDCALLNQDKTASFLPFRQENHKILEEKIKKADLTICILYFLHDGNITHYTGIAQKDTGTRPTSAGQQHCEFEWVNLENPIR